MSGDRFLKSILVISLIVLAATLPVAWWLGGLPSVIGALGGAVLGMANFWAMTRLLQRLLFGKGGARSKGLATTLLAVKLGVFVFAAWLAVRIFGLDVLGFLFGFSAVVIALFVGGLKAALDGMEEDEPS